MAKQATKESTVKSSKDIAYHKITISCACGATFEAGQRLNQFVWTSVPNAIRFSLVINALWMLKAASKNSRKNTI